MHIEERSDSYTKNDCAPINQDNDINQQLET